MNLQDLTAFLRGTTRSIVYSGWIKADFTYSEFIDAVSAVFTEDELKAAREWLNDSQRIDVDQEDMNSFPPYAIVRGMSRNYDGGIAGFLACI